MFRHAMDDLCCCYSCGLAVMHIADDGGWCSLHIHCIFAGQAFDYTAGRIPYECVVCVCVCVCVCEYASATAV